ncbi:MAG: META domain-containing protein [Actinomycetota bacterium]
MSLAMVSMLTVCTGGGARLEGRWNVKSLDGKPMGDVSRAQEPPWVAFGGGEVTGWEGCNHLGGPYAYEEGLLRIDSEETFSTLAGCGGQAEKFSERFADVILSGPLVVKFADSGAVVTLSAPEGSVELSRS